MECPFIGRVSRYLGASMPGVSIKYCIRLNKSNAFTAYVWSPDAMAYSDMAMAANDSEKI